MPDRRIGVVALVIAGVASGCTRQTAPADRQNGAPVAASLAATPDPSTTSIYLCPMDKDIRSYGPGKCPRCGMTLVTSIPDPVEYHLELSLAHVPAAGAPVRLTYRVTDPWKGNPVTAFEVVHEKMFHAFVVSQDLQFFLHAHPTWADGAFVQDLTLPGPGVYRVLADFYPQAATPQLLTETVVVPGTPPRSVTLTRDYSTKHTENLTVSMATNVETPVAGTEALVRFSLDPADGLERYLGVWAHMLIASDDLIDLMHQHPLLANGADQLQFNIIFPRPRTYRLWVQFQRHGVVNTAHFDVVVRAPPTASAPARR
jgi:hypothetical protein